MELPFAEAWKIKMVEPIRKSMHHKTAMFITHTFLSCFPLIDAIYNT